METQELLLREGIACQKRTGRHKKFTFYYQDKIYKGPYTYQQLEKLDQRYHTLRDWNTQHLVYSIDYIEGCSSSEEYWIIFPNVGIGEVRSKDRFSVGIGETNSNAGLSYTQHQESFSNHSYKVLNRTGLIKLSDALDRGYNAYQHRTSLTISLIKLLLLGVGDRGFYNYLYDTDSGEVYLVDIDESSSTLRDSPWFYLSKDPSKKYRTKWNQALDKQIVIEAISSLPNAETVEQLIQRL